MTRKMIKSLQRRILLTGHVWRWVDSRVMKMIPVALNPKIRKWIYKAFRRMAMIIVDLMESFVLMRPVPLFANLADIHFRLNVRVNQHPGYLDYWFDAEKNSLVGLHLGLDAIRKEGKFHLVELNAGPGISSKLRSLFDTEYDPIFTSYLQFAGKRGFRKIRFYKNSWKDFSYEEVKSLNQIQDIQISLVNPLEDGEEGLIPMPLENNTLYIISSSRLTPIQKMLSDKYSLSQWMQAYYRRNPELLNVLAIIPTWDFFHFPDNQNSDHYPNLVVKLSDFDRKTGIVMIRAENKEQAKAILGIRHKHSLPKLFRLNMFKKWQVRWFGAKVIYQPFVASELSDDHCLNFHRIHAFFSPAEDFFVITYKNTSDFPVREPLPVGFVSNIEKYTPWSELGSTFIKGTEEEIRMAEQAVRELGQLIKKLITKKFVTGPESTTSELNDNV